MVHINYWLHSLFWGGKKEAKKKEKKTENFSLGIGKATLAPGTKNEGGEPQDWAKQSRAALGEVGVDMYVLSHSNYRNFLLTSLMEKLCCCK